ncbi:cupin domain-containing protein [Thiotrichales bacterium HSG1]|nr:cupin domain-containing protein [Thiotrichales bacterium HSG1]
MPNIFDNIPKQLPEELTNILVNSNGVKIERIISQGHRSEFWYDQTENEWVIVLRGSAKLKFELEDKTICLNAGDFINIKAHVKHKVEWTSEEVVWLAVFYPAH